MDVKPKDFNFEIDDLNNDCITSNILTMNFTKISLGKKEYMTRD